MSSAARINRVGSVQCPRRSSVDLVLLPLLRLGGAPPGAGARGAASLVHHCAKLFVAQLVVLNTKLS